METFRLLAYACMLVFTAVALVSDLRTRKLPNLLTVPVFALGLVFHVVNGFCQSGIKGMFWDANYGTGLGFALGGFAVGFGIMLVLWIIGGGGGGDVKFMGALGCWLGAWLTLQVLVLGSLLSGVLTFTVFVKNTFQMKQSKLTQSNGRTQRGGKKKADFAPPLRYGGAWRVPFGVPAAVATWCLLILSATGHGLSWETFLKVITK
jgi:prepilin peptidase CpaA